MASHLDERWYKRLRDITATVGETFNLLEPTPEVREIMYQKFLDSGCTEPVPLFPDPAVKEPLKEPYEQLAQLRQEIDENEQIGIVREQYLNYIDDVRANIDVIRAACDKNPEDYEKLNDLLYGKPDKAIYEDVCEWIRQDTIEILTKAEDELLVSLGQGVLKRLPQTNGDYLRLSPSKEVFHSVREAHFRPGGFFDMLFGEEGMPDEPYITQQEGDVICQRVLDNIGADYKIVDAYNHIWSVSREPRQLLRPAGYRIGRDEFVGIVAHEIGSHILESVNGAKQPLQLLEMGLAGYVLANEGRALLREQIVYEDIATSLWQPSWEYCIMQHLAISLSLGYHEDRRYRLPEIYDLLYYLYYFWRSRRHPHETNNELYARKEAWLLTVRLLKGTDGLGGAYQKDIVYLEGNVKLWQMAANDPNVILFGDIGKFNLLDEKQRSILSFQ